MAELALALLTCVIIGSLNYFQSTLKPELEKLAAQFGQHLHKDRHSFEFAKGWHSMVMYGAYVDWVRFG